MFRSIARVAAPAFRPSTLVAARPAAAFKPMAQLGLRFSSHESETYDEFNARYQEFFNNAPDLFEVQRGMNNCFAYDLVPTVEVIEAMLRAARRCNDFPTAVRALEGVKVKVEKDSQYEAYLKELAPLMQELGVPTREDLFH